MQSSGQASRHLLQPMQALLNTQWICPLAPTMASVGQARKQRVQPVHSAASMRASMGAASALASSGTPSSSARRSASAAPPGGRRPAQPSRSREIAIAATPSRTPASAPATKPARVADSVIQPCRTRLRFDVTQRLAQIRPLTEAEGGPDEVALMKPGAILINAARGGVLVEPDLAQALGAGRLRGAGIDVFSVEPIQPDNPLLALDIPRVILTPHIGGSTLEAQGRIGEEVARKLLSFLDTGSTGGAVNFPHVDRKSVV